MQEKLTQTIVQKIAPTSKRQKIKDLILPGLMLRVEPSGKKTWYVDYKRPNGQRTYYKIGSAEILTVTQARDVAQKFLASVTLGNDPLEVNAATEVNEVNEEKKEPLTLKQLLFDFYERWVLDNRKSGKETIEKITGAFGDFMDVPIEKITLLEVEQWRSDRRKNKNTKGSTLNRYTTALKALFNWAIKRGIVENNPLSKLEPLSEKDSVKKVRYLTEDERARLMAALDEREKEIRQKRERHNQWLEDREQETVPSIQEGNFADYLKPLIILCLNTGIRRSAILSLEWGDIDFTEKTIVVRAETDKSEKEYYVPFNDLTSDTLSIWHRQSQRTSPKDLVFPSPQTGEKMNDCRTSWENLLQRANIQKFRWHDMRHDFASQLVMAGVDLNTVRELMGHANLKMTLRYAHLAPENKLQAIKALDKRNRPVVVQASTCLPAQ